MDTLPLILLGIRTVLKEDISATTAEMVYGTTLRLPGEFFSPSPANSLSDPSDQLKTHFWNLQAIPTRFTNRTLTFLPD